MNARPGEMVGQRYTLTTRIATGGMGQVWQATDSVLGRTVAIKLLSAGYSEDSGFAQRFRDEAKHAARLSHPGIAAVYDYGENGDGSAYLVMEYVPGEPLSQMIARDAPLEPGPTCAILAQAADALQAAHDGGVIHRDVKPANIMLTPDGTVKLTDFGISRAIGGNALTRTGEVMGTAQYLAPEQALGRAPTAATDIYALGIIGYEMLCGRRPFDSESVVATALAQVHDAPPPLPGVIPQSLSALVMRALRKDPADRPATAAQLGRELRDPLVLTEPAPTAVLNAPTAQRTAPLPVAATEQVPLLAGEGRPGQREPDWRLAAAAGAGGAAGSAGARTRYDGPRGQPPRRRRGWVWFAALLVVLLGAGAYTLSTLQGSGSPGQNHRPLGTPSSPHSKSTSSPPSTRSTRSTTNSSSSRSSSSSTPTSTSSSSSSTPTRTSSSSSSTPTSTSSSSPTSTSSSSTPTSSSSSSTSSSSTSSRSTSSSSSSRTSPTSSTSPGRSRPR